MNIKTIQENIVELAMEEMTEDGIHHDDFPDRESEYVAEIVKDLLEINEKKQEICLINSKYELRTSKRIRRTRC